MKVAFFLARGVPRHSSNENKELHGGVHVGDKGACGKAWWKADLVKIQVTSAASDSTYPPLSLHSIWIDLGRENKQKVLRRRGSSRIWTATDAVRRSYGNPLPFCLLSNGDEAAAADVMGVARRIQVLHRKFGVDLDEDWNRMPYFDWFAMGADWDMDWATDWLEGGTVEANDVEVGGDEDIRRLCRMACAFHGTQLAHTSDFEMILSLAKQMTTALLRIGAHDQSVAGSENFICRSDNLPRFAPPKCCLLLVSTPRSLVNREPQPDERLPILVEDFHDGETLDDHVVLILPRGGPVTSDVLNTVDWVIRPLARGGAHIEEAEGKVRVARVRVCDVALQGLRAAAGGHRNSTPHQPATLASSTATLGWMKHNLLKVLQINSMPSPSKHLFVNWAKATGNALVTPASNYVYGCSDVNVGTDMGLALKECGLLMRTKQYSLLPPFACSGYGGHRFLWGKIPVLCFTVFLWKSQLIRRSKKESALGNGNSNCELGRVAGKQLLSERLEKPQYVNGTEGNGSGRALVKNPGVVPVFSAVYVFDRYLIDIMLGLSQCFPAFLEMSSTDFILEQLLGLPFWHVQHVHQLSNQNRPTALEAFGCSNSSCCEPFGKTEDKGGSSHPIVERLDWKKRRGPRASSTLGHALDKMELMGNTWRGEKAGTSSSTHALLSADAFTGNDRAKEVESAVEVCFACGGGTADAFLTLGDNLNKGEAGQILGETVYGVGRSLHERTVAIGEAATAVASMATARKLMICMMIVEQVDEDKEGSDRMQSVARRHPNGWKSKPPRRAAELWLPIKLVKAFAALWKQVCGHQVRRDQGLTREGLPQLYVDHWVLGLPTCPRNRSKFLSPSYAPNHNILAVKNDLERVSGLGQLGSVQRKEERPQCETPL
ncbi:hypothetical protein BDK51DRAFT_27148 [Blyttiomyces helicus]|uniref:Uncharacterized protein n=1 Tax=Blyttiomyces helicus TaxID=388810 RepID=A0A4P9WA25_9FUNG|nr:hypothetical protein BDK51DRAFT_27148 [Blyttiomyces helicus]|eukprot:RKO87690.1 hypothetical protein BDK51DRAFT_27148 [Blyttiomyces helicus]